MYNGSISETLWRTESDNIIRKYGYKYDGFNRLTDAIYQKSLGNILSATHAYDESLQYDKNGNISTLIRNGYLDSDNGITYPIDELTYEYAPHSNKLINIEDNTLSNDGFKEKTGSNLDYEYDHSGNLVIDNNKGIEKIEYNHMNLPVQIWFSNGTIEYVYDALGNKKEKKISNQVTTTLVVNYLNGFQYFD